MLSDRVPAQYEGRLITTYGEENGYHDSYWHALVWNDEKNAPENVTVGSTAFGGNQWRPVRGISSLTEDRREKYEAYQRRRRIETDWKLRGYDIEERKRLGMKTYHELRKLYAAYPNSSYYTERWGREYNWAREALEALLCVKKFRSKFRESIAQQVRAWLAGETEYERPLTDKQLRAIATAPKGARYR